MSQDFDRTTGALNPYKVESTQRPGGPLNFDDRTSALNSARWKIYLRIMPLLFICYVIAYVDRTNVGIAKLTMKNDLQGFDDWVFGFGSGIFFIGYFLLEIPGSIIVERWSARKWICRIMVTWGILAALTAFVKTPIQFYSVRFLLGLAEAGFFPGVIVYLTHWFPAKDRARAIAGFLIASPIAMIVGNGVSRYLLQIGDKGNPRVLDLAGWQWVYIFWGVPAVVMGIAVLVFLTDRPRDAMWLTKDERDSLEDELAKEKAAHRGAHLRSALAGLINPRVWILAIAYFGVVTANYGLEMFLPSVLEEWFSAEPYSFTASGIATLAMIPSLLVIIGQLLNGWSSDHFKERYWHAIVPIVFGAAVLICVPHVKTSLVLAMVCFTIAAAGMKAYMPAFWSLPNTFLTATAAAGSVGLINSVGNLGGFLGPYTMGYVKTYFKSYDYGLYFLAMTSLISAMIVFSMRFIPMPSAQSDDESSQEH
ncbi:MAG: MFS transporter [Pirellulales bacterium]